jgi:membrane protease YdiL (CAAX protease family)
MSEPLPPPEPTRPRGRPILAWLVIAAVIGFVVYRGQASQGGWKERLGVVLLELQARVLVGQTQILGTKGAELYKQSQVLNRGDYSQRLRFAILAGELAGRDEADKLLRRLQKLWADHNVEPPPEEARFRDLLERLYQGQPLSAEESKELRQGLGWFGELALGSSPEDTGERQAALATARRSALSVMAITVLVVMLVLSGVVLLGVLLSLWLTGRLRGGLETGVAPGGVYIEAFALWLLTFYGLSLVFAVVPQLQGLPWLTLPGMVLPLGVLGWPVLRGVPWAQVRRDVGLTLGPRPWRDLGAGLATYLAVLPVVAVGMVVVSIVLLWGQKSGPSDNPFGPPSTPGHPAVELLARGSLWLRLLVLLEAAVLAPLIEETVFRGLLYRHLREGTSRLGRVGSVLVSMLAGSFLFAVIHPQGLLGLPILMPLACAFTLAREWRGTLLPGMLCHGLNNSFPVVFVLLVGG